MTTAYQDIHREIIELSKAGNPKAQYQLYQLYSKAMFNISYRMMNNREEAEDMLQESFTEAFTKLDTFRYESSFGSWIKRIVINKCINELKRKKAELVLTENIPDNSADNEEDDFEVISLKVNDVMKAMEKLPEGYRVIFSLYLLEGYDHTEIAQIMGITESTSKSQFSRAKQKMKELLKQSMS
ncbi:MAG: sigma-70 family RNA polymerase sigma factor [Bacteroidales bacterium]|nr:sigma-70 family RNA polymerase sigma factor [Bacteroidales bacterium]